MHQSAAGRDAGAFGGAGVLLPVELAPLPDEVPHVLRLCENVFLKYFFEESSNQGPMLWFLKIFPPKNSAKNWHF
jgi:hypothetical protein